MDHGYTNDPSRAEAVRAWRAAAIADGWSAEATYGSAEPIERAMRLSRGGFTVQTILREKVGQWAYQASLSMWAPDGLTCDVPVPYDGQRIATLARHCIYCKADDVETFRVGFAGRACAACLPVQRERAERPGWDL